MKKVFAAALTMITLCQMTGCFSLVSTRTPAMDYIRGDVRYEIRVGASADTHKEIIETDVEIDKDRFVDLFNENAKYDPNTVKHELSGASLKIDPVTQQEDWNEITYSEVNIRAVFDDGLRSVSLYEYDSDLYLFAVSIGNAGKKEDRGYYYMKLPDEMQDYWQPVYEEIRSDAEEYHMETYGSFSIDPVSSYDGKYLARPNESGDNITVMILTDDVMKTTSFSPCRKSDFYGICWEEDSYSLWIQSGDIGVICYRLVNGKWAEDPDAVRPDYIISRYD